MVLANPKEGLDSMVRRAEQRLVPLDDKWMEFGD